MIPPRITAIPAFGTFSQQPECVTADYKAMLQKYYEAKGWARDTGIPTKEKCIELVIDHL